MTRKTPTQDAVNDNVIPLHTEPPAPVDPLTDAEIIQFRQMLREWQIVRATCPMATRLLSKR